MADNYINVTVTSKQNKRVTVSTQDPGYEVTATTDTGKFWANTAEKWATSDTIVENKDYSSKYYANKAKTSEENARVYENAVKDTYNTFIAELGNITDEVRNAGQESLNNIESSRVDAVDSINTVKNTAVDDINSTKTNILNDIEFVADGEKKEIEYLVETIKDNAEDIINRVGISMFDTILKDHILTYEETKGLALQGTYVYKEAIAGSRYGYPDFYNRVVEEFNEATSTETVNGVTVKVHSNGHKFYDIADKTGIDGFFDSYGYAWFYGVDTENERVFLPRNNWFEQATGDISEVGRGVEAGLPYSRIYTETAGLNDYYGNENGNTQYNVSGTSSGNGAILRAAGSQSNFDGLYIQDNNGTYGKSNTVQPPAVKKLLYICVGNTTSYEGMTEVVNQGMEILEQVNQGIESRLDVDVTNLTDTGKENVMGLLLPDLTTEITRSNSGFTSDKKQWLYVFSKDAGYTNKISINGVLIFQSNIGYTTSTPIVTTGWHPLDSGDVVTTQIGQGGSLELKTYSMKGVK